MGVIPYLWARDLPSAPVRERGCLGAGADMELGQDAAHVMLGSLRADEQARGNLGVREPITDQGEDLALALGEGLDGLGAGPGGTAELSYQCGRPICLADRAERFEALLRRACLIERHPRSLDPYRLGEGEPRSRRFERQLELPE
jgi:hypothetical protein